MKKATIWLLILVLSAAVFILTYPIYKSLTIVCAPDAPIASLHEYTVLDMETGKQMVLIGDDNIHEFVTNDTAWRDDHRLYQSAEKSPENAMKVVIVATYNQLY
jgi:hypothetical protein